MPASLHALPDGRHIAVGHHASIAQLDRALADMDPDQHAVILEQSTLGDHHAQIEQELRDARKRIAQLEAERDQPIPEAFAALLNRARSEGIQFVPHMSVGSVSFAFERGEDAAVRWDEDQWCWIVDRETKRGRRGQRSAI